MSANNLWQLKKETFGAALGFLAKGKELPQDIKDIVEFSFGWGIPPLEGPDTVDCFFHPLSARCIKLEFDPAEAREKLSGALEEFCSKASSKDPQRDFVRLWWELPRKIPEIRTLPAHPDCPVYSLYNAASMASAAAACWPEPALGIVSLAGVQDFISLARRTQDLWMASFMLSWLTWQVIKVIAQELGPDNVLMPHLYDQPLFAREFLGEKVSADSVRVANLPNIFSFLAPWSKAPLLIEEMKKALKTGLETLFEGVRASLEQAICEALPKEQWEKAAAHLRDSLNFFYAVVPFPQKKEDLDELLPGHLPEEDQQHKQYELLKRFFDQYGRVRGMGASYVLLSQKAGAYFSRVKLYRPFVQQVVAGERCTLCGSFTALFGENASYAAVRKKFEELQGVQDRSKGLKLAGRLRRGEILCPVCLTKRLVCEAFFEKELEIDHHLFPSTADLATAPFKEAVLKNWEALQAEAEDYAAKVQTLVELTGIASNSLPALWQLADTPEKKSFLRADGEWLFEESLDPARIERVYGIRIDGAILSEIKKSLLALKKRIKTLVREGKWQGASTPGRYFAFIAADGDKMGEILKGPGSKVNPRYWRDYFVREEKLPPAFREAHFPISPHYHRFVAERLRIFAMEKVPKIEELALARLIYAGGDDVFAMSSVSQVLELVSYLARAYQSEDVFDGGATLSMAVILAHHRTPFYLVAERVHKLLKEKVKEGLGRNAWGVLLMRRSGEETFFGARFLEGKILKGFENVISHLASGRVAGGVLTPLEALESGARGLPAEALKKTISYLVKRASSGEHSGSFDFADFYQALLELEEKIKKDREASPDSRIMEFNAYESFLAALKIARFLAKGD
ncbi:type III-B CRISPR-associated protein Cas10/Cmr2 [Thermodesulfatator atlanticus]|uniref:type III-B CRISPR-associated protein Cas10/Cmr2 n=1 Tax=Thermodesulfatator atlanticus TaxID=501497 RepID=UPI0003B51085|nr:type III-B CRISPR-associated protein Cas10/Cmr2 [Thermodesulfatator atlanticus]